MEQDVHQENIHEKTHENDSRKNENHINFLSRKIIRIRTFNIKKLIVEIFREENIKGIRSCLLVHRITLTTIFFKFTPIAIICIGISRIIVKFTRITNM